MSTPTTSPISVTLASAAVDRLANVFAKVFSLPREKFSEALTADSVSNWDSLRHLKLIVELEKEFGIRIRTREMSKLTSVKKILAVVVASNPEAP